MKFDVEHVSDTRKKINVVLPKETVDDKIDKAYARIKRKAKIKGFRTGKAPKHILEKYYRDRVMEDVLNEVLQESYPAILAEKGIEPVSYPHYGGEIPKEGEDFAFSFTVDVKPKIKLKDYEGIRIEKAKPVITEEEINSEIDGLRRKLATFNPVEGRGVKRGDHVVIDFEGFVGGQAIAGGKGENYTLEIGSNAFIPGFEEGLIGFETGQEGEVKGRFPDAYHVSDLAGKEALFRVLVKEIKILDLPPLDDEFARDIGDYGNLQELRERLLADLRDSKEKKEEKSIQKKLIDSIIEKNPFDVPESMVDRQAYYRMEDVKRMMKGFGMNPDEIETSLSNRREEIYKEAEEEVKGGMILEAVAEHEGILVNNDDIEAYVKELAEKSGRPSEEVMNFYADKMSYLKNTLRDKKVFDFLIGKSIIIEKEGSSK